ncbi:MAG: UDP-N-acetylglucosamine--N-acetylmuramyl-(pentapeptide) pyrophosphoryl-undecaprenol N-acetylglucosamine transferase [Candidatus Omnitrophica bacterium]|nr:UDP-N-acetylglucosamine--N-acetylmuramyl-(pentapeptide) pyrophosphoryl-undecaprenol N-acetylglucosamine transferase [Candidatus Omnitrophota bacterium]
MNPSKAKTIIIFSGHTGGHLFPALSFADEFKHRHPEFEIIFVGGRSEAALPFGWQAFPYKYRVIDMAPWKGGLLKRFRFQLSFLGAWRDVLRLFREVNPSLVVGFGALVSVPGVLAARFRKIPTLIHEQNLKFGKANKLLCSFAELVAVSFKETLSGLPEAKGVWTGYPLRQSFFKARIPGRGNSRFNLLILGGSQGAKRLNCIVVRALRGLSDEEREKIAVIHITGRNNLEEAESFYSGLAIDRKLIGFTDEIEEFYTQSDFVVGRAGAGTIFEAAYFGLAALFIPYPGAGNHQKDNAGFIAAHGAGMVITEDKLSEEALISLLRSAINNPSGLNAMKESARKLFHHDSGERLTNAAERLLKTSCVS